MLDSSTPVSIDLAFTVEPPSVKQIRLWAKFCEQATNAHDMNVLRDAYSAFMWQWYAVEAFTHIQSLLASGDQNIHLALSWFDLLVQDVQWVSDGWVRVVTVFQQHEIPGARWERDALSNLQATQELLTQACAYVATVSACYGFPMSERLQRACAGVLPGWTLQQTSSPLQQ